LSIPPPPHSCPPAAYEFALLLAGQIRSKRLSGKVLVLDANTQPEPPPLSAAFDGALRRTGVVEYIPLIRVARLEAEARRVVSTDGEAFSYDLLSLIPAHKAARFIREAGLSEGVDPFVQVDPLSFRAMRHETVYALGDAARTPYARSAAPAFDAARLCAHSVAKTLGAKRIASPPLAFEAPCYPYVTREQAMSLRLRYRREKDADLDIEVTTDTRLDRAHVAARRAWQRGLMREIFGA
jgi:hypothetical protein